ncbi:MAG: MmgE/PrpD family protein [Pseudomonadota bacterium]
MQSSIMTASSKTSPERPHIARSSGDSVTERLLTVCAMPVAEPDLRRASLLLMDWCGIALAAAGENAAPWAREWVARSGSAGTCLGIGVGQLQPEPAAFVNGSLGTLLEMDDLHRASILHAGDVVIPAALAAAQFSAAPPGRLLEAILCGYEVALRIGTAAAEGGYTGWYNTGTCGVFGAAMAAAHAAGLSDEAKRDALGQAGMQAAGIWQCRLEPTDSKALAAAHAARAGITAAFMAEHGCRGARHVLEGPLGFFPLFYPQADPLRVLDAPTDRWKVHDVSFKPWPACRHVHPAVGLAIDMRDNVDLQAISRMTVRTYAAAIDFCDRVSPQTAHEARFSLQHCVAVALIHGRLGLADTQAPALGDAALARLRQCIDLAEEPILTAGFPHRMGARLEIETRDGTVLADATEHALGDPEVPFDVEGLTQKFHANLAFAGVAQTEAAEIIAALSELPRTNTLARLDAALSAAAGSLKNEPREDKKYD